MMSSGGDRGDAEHFALLLFFLRGQVPNEIACGKIPVAVLYVSKVEKAVQDDCGDDASCPYRHLG